MLYVSFSYIPGKWYSTHFKSFEEAEDWARKRMRKDLVVIPDEKEITFRSFSRNFFTPRDPHGYIKRNRLHHRDYTDFYYENQQRRLKKYLIPKFGPFLISAITPVMIEHYLVHEVKTRKGRELSEDSRNKLLFCLRIVFEEAVRKGYLAENPARRVEIIRPISAVREPFELTELVTMFPYDQQKLLDIWEDRLWACYFLILRDTGFRPGETAALRPIDINRELHGIYTTRSVDALNGRVKNSIKTTGSGYQYKVGLLSKQCLEQLSLLERQKQLGQEELYFELWPGRCVTPQVANKQLKGALARAGIEQRGRTQYCFRHAFQTRLAGNIDQSMLLELMAHTRFRKEYDHRKPEDILRQLQPVRKFIDTHD